MVSWFMLVVVTFAVIVYSLIRVNAPIAVRHEDLLLFARELAGSRGYNVSLPGHDGLEDALFPPKVLGCDHIPCNHFSLDEVDREALGQLLVDGGSTRPVKQLLLKEELV